MNHSTQQKPAPSETSPLWLRLVIEKVKGLQFGSVMITVHDGRVTQVETAEKLRIQPEETFRSGN